MSNSRYPWIVTRTTHRRDLPPLEAKEYPAVETCSRCGYTPVGVRHRKKCPACFVRLEAQAGHLGGSLEQLVWVVVLIVAIVLLVRVAGVTW